MDQVPEGMRFRPEEWARVEGMEPEDRRRYLEIKQRASVDDENTKLALAFSLRATSNCIDVGACTGTFLSHYARLAPGGRHLAFEPIPQLGRELRERWPEMDVRCAALGDTAGEADFVYVPESPYWSGFRRQEYPYPMATETIRVPVFPLDDCLPGGYLPDFLKVDVEGAELQVFRGAVRTLRAARPLTVFEYGRAATHYGTVAADIYDVLVTEAGLRIFDLDGVGPYSLAQLEDSCAADARWNYLAHE